MTRSSAQRQWSRRAFPRSVVFVGYGETEELEQIEHFATVFSSEDRGDLSGVEIAATAFANLRDDRTLRELPFVSWLALTFSRGSPHT